MSDTNSEQPDETRPFRMLSPGAVISHYKIVEQIGAGGMGVVYKALDTKLDRTVALKFLPQRLLCDADARERFEHEAKAASALNHPNIMTIYEVDEVEGQCFIAMEYIDGPSLRTVLAGKDMSLDDMLDIATQIAEGLTAAHGKAVVHRDLKPANIMMTSTGRVEITDFGLAKLKGVTKLTKTGTTLGTLPYMSPEQVQGKDVDRRSDIFSLGVVLYEMIAGRLPFRGDNEAAVVRSIMSDTPEPLARYKADVPEGIQRIVTKALAKDLEQRYQHADDLLADLKHEKRTSELAKVAWAEREAMAPKKRKLVYRLAGLVAVLAAVAIIYFVLEPFRVEMGPRRAAVAAENSIAIMYFENIVDHEDVDKVAQMITALLITDLSESEYVRVVSRQRLYDILKMLGREDLKVIDKTVATEVAEKAGVKWILTGSILRTDPNLVLTADISDASTGEVLATQRVEGEAGEDLFVVADRLSRMIKEDLALPKEAEAEADLPVADLTTHSPEAYRYYVEGWDYLFKHYYSDAEQSFRKTLEYDSTFAIAYWGLAYVTEEPERSRLMKKAVKYSEKASRKEQLFIKAMAARFAGRYREAVGILTEAIDLYPHDDRTHLSLGIIYNNYLGEAEKAIYHLKKALEINPLDKESLNQLAYAYSRIGDLDNAIWAINEYIAMVPDEANPYDTRGDLYAFNGKLDEAIESYRKACEIKPGFSTSRLGEAYVLKRDYARAESCFKEMASADDKWVRSRGRLGLAYAPLYQGKFDEALKVLADGIGADRMEQTLKTSAAGKHRLRAVIYIEKGDFEAAVEAARMNRELRLNANPNDSSFAVDFFAGILVEAGNLAEAERLTEPIRARHESGLGVTSVSDWLVLGLIESGRGNLEEAIELLSAALEAEDQPYFHIRTYLAEAYIDAGRLGEAVELLEAALSDYGRARAMVPIRAVRAYYWLGRAYEGSGWTAKAVEQYETFLEIWKDADPGIAAVEDARRRIAHVKGTS